jgi:Mn-dependent DtxR family transcriptional regulator
MAGEAKGMLKKTLLFILSAFLFSTGVSPAFGAADPPDIDEYTRLFLSRHAIPNDDPHMLAVLEGLDLFKGTEKGAELDRGLTRTEALVTIVRLRGAEEEALARNLKNDFSDVPDWAAAYAGFGRAQGFVRGVGGDRFGANDPVTAKQYATMLLRLLGYDDAIGDFSYDTALDFACDAALIDEWAAAYYREREEENAAFLRRDAVYFMYEALYAPTSPASSDKTVIAKLYREGLIDREKAAGTMLARGESETEILRALENGYSEVLLAAATKALEENASVLSDVVRNTFKNSLYNWNKEAGSAKGAELFAHNARNLELRDASPRQDSLLRANPEIAAYFSYPNRIVIRRDLDAGSIESTLTHEFRHALSADIGLTILEEGITEFWSQEVDGGYYGYPYYFVNLAKLLFHTAGAEAVNAGDLTGDYEDLFYALEKESGVDIDNVRFYSLLADISPSVEESISDMSEEFFADLAAVNAIFFETVRGHYLNNAADRVAESANYEAFIDRLSALGQLLYYPSAMIRRADSNEVSELPSSYYGEAFLSFVNEATILYCAITGADAATVLRYFEESKDRRFCLEYLGRDAGVMFVKEGTGYRVTFRSEGGLYYNDFGTREDADKFAAGVNAVSTETIAGAGFVPKETLIERTASVPRLYRRRVTV